MPVFNGERFLAAAIECILAQTHTDLELILSDNASTDSTADICDYYRVRDSRVRYFRQSSNIGPTANFHFVMDSRRGEYFMWAAYDDVRGHDYLSRVLELLTDHPTAVLAHCWQQILESTNAEIPSSYGSRKGYPDGIRSEMVAERIEAFTGCRDYSAFYGLYRSEVLSGIGKPLDCFNSDGEYLLRVVLAGPILVCPETLFFYRVLNSADTYRRWFQTSGDEHLANFRLYAGTILRSRLSPSHKLRALQAFYRTKRTDLTLRAEWLTHQLLVSNGTKREKAIALLSIARQFPPFAARRMFWGALRRQLPFQ
jgi:glycosyltransferase involved in cell wall biosynthesis